MRLLLCDAHNLYYRAYFGGRYANLHTSDGKPTWAIHSFINSLAMHIRAFEPTHLLGAFDWGHSEFRLGVSRGTYKQARRNDGDEPETEARRQANNLLKILPLFGVFVHREYGIEADDVIASCVYRFKDEAEAICVISGDKDVVQLVDTNVTVIKPALGGKTQKAEVVWTLDSVFERYGLIPEMLPHVWALSGDPTDGIPGVPGIGEKTAIKLIKEYGSADAVAASSEKKIMGNESVIAQTYKLVRLDGSLAQCHFSKSDLEWHSTDGDSPLGKELRSVLDDYELATIKTRWLEGTLFSAAREVKRKELRVAR